MACAVVAALIIIVLILGLICQLIVYLFSSPAGAVMALIFLAMGIGAVKWMRQNIRRREAEREREQHKFDAEALEAYRRFYRIHFPAWLFDVTEKPFSERRIPVSSFINDPPASATAKPKPFKMPVQIRAELRRDLGPCALALVFAFRELFDSRRAILAQRVYKVREIASDGNVVIRQRTLTNQEVERVMDEFPITFAQAAARAGETALRCAGPQVTAFKRTLKEKLEGEAYSERSYGYAWARGWLSFARNAARHPVDDPIGENRIEWRKYWAICFDLEFPWATERKFRYSTQWQARPAEAQKNLAKAFGPYWWSCSGWALGLVAEEADRVRNAWEARKQEIRRREEERRRRIEADRVRRVDEASEMRAAGRALTPEQWNLLLEDAAIRQAVASEATADAGRIAAHAAMETARQTARVAQAAEEAAELQERRLYEERAYRIEERERSEKTQKATIAAATLGYVAAKSIANDTAERVVKAIQESNK